MLILWKKKESMTAQIKSSSKDKIRERDISVNIHKLCDPLTSEET